MDHIMFPEDDNFRRLTNSELDIMFPEEGYKVLEPSQSNVLSVLEENMLQKPDGLPLMKPDDDQYFGSLLNKEYEEYEEELTQDEKKDREIMKLLLMVKNGDRLERETGLCQLNDKAREFGVGPLFNCILPLIMMYTLEEHDRRMLGKVIYIALYKLDELVQPHVRRMLILIQPLLIDEKYYARLDGREIISKYSRATWLINMISVVNPDLNNIHEYVGNTIADAYSVVALALGIPPLLPFLKDLCQSKKLLGIKIVEQIAIQMGCRVFPHLEFLVKIIKHGLSDENETVRKMTGFTIAALAEAAGPYGIEGFDSVLKPLWKSILSHHGKDLTAFLKAIGFIISLMDDEYAGIYTKEVMVILIREFQSPDEEMKQIVLKVVKQCVSHNGVEADYIRSHIIPEFFKNFWVRGMSLDRKKLLIETTVEIANKVGVTDIVAGIMKDLKDECEDYRRMAMETIEKVLTKLVASDIDARMEELLIDGIMYAFQEQTSDDDDSVMLNGFSTVVISLGQRVKHYLPQICGMIIWRLNNKCSKVKQQAAVLISRIAAVIKQCQEEQLMGHLGVVLYEYLGEECPEVLGSILGALKEIVIVNGMPKDLLPHLSVIVNNTNEKVQENCIDLLGRIAVSGGEFIPPTEWMGICSQLLEMLNSDKKEIRIATMKAFGYISKAIGPVDVLAILLNNLRSQAAYTSIVAITIIAETCSPVIVLPALVNAYCVPELNLKNNVLKSTSFLFEYLGVTKKEYIYAVTPLLTNALKDRNLDLKQNAASVVKHIALGGAGLGCEDALIHLLNYVWPLIFETSPDCKYGVMEAIDAIGMALGPSVMLNYILQGLFHPARKVRKVYWEIYNSLYIGSQDALVAAYPMLEDEGANFYGRHELNTFI